MRGTAIKRLLPFTDWLVRYKRKDLSGDLVAGAIVAIMLIPQSLAYAMLAGLPPQYGLYAGIAPLLIYGLLGTSRTLSVGPVAVISLLTAAALAPLAEPFSAEYVGLALLLALMTGVIQLVLGLLRAGFVANLLSHPVVTGFITGSSILIIVSQLQHLLGVSHDSGRLPWQAVAGLARSLPDTNLTTLGLGLSAIAFLLLARAPLRGLLRRLGASDALALLLSRTAPALLVVAGIGAVVAFRLDTRLGVAVVGKIAAGLPGFTVPAFDVPLIGALAPAALMIVLAGYVESISVGRALGARRRQNIDANQELVALGAANIAGGFTGGFPVSGGFSRSVVNFDAGANTGLASIVTAILMAVITLFAASMFASLPQVVLAATVIVAVAGLVNFKELRHLWRYSRAEGALMALTIAGVLGLGVEAGIAIGVGASLLLHLARVSRPHIAIVGRVGGERFMNIKRHSAQTFPGLLLVRVDENLFFGNIRSVEDRVLQHVAEEAGLKHLVIVFSAVNYVDASALEALVALIHKLRERGIALHLSEVKGPVMDRLSRVGLCDHLNPGRVFRSTAEAVAALVDTEANAGPECTPPDR